ncbi:hypothetical protein, conserved [Plasmodium ovale wallikeri]|uniref:Suppressor of forked domain-containing protein n=1 Tax=Plasmodium ovale wallikeri TaxID=864142 RepID=A0A1A8YXX4_PLAOA|nr:hypothetical protein, conserved [Plasmodium ovale wallikeri]SBT36430.1 hypothetical protein, conserved [Plasmodium ovale wallikeri]
MIKGEVFSSSLREDASHDELVTAKQLFDTHLKVDERTREIWKNFNEEEYALEIMQNRLKGGSEKGAGAETGQGGNGGAGNDGAGNDGAGNGRVEQAKTMESINWGGGSEGNVGCKEEEANIAFREGLQFLRENPLHMQTWYEFLETYDREEAYEQFLVIFPRCTFYWIKYAELKIKKKEYIEAYRIYRRCIDSNIYDLKLFFSFLYFTYHTSSIHEYISFLFEGLKHVGTDIKSGNIWVELLYILIKIYNTNLMLNNDIDKLLCDPFKNVNHGRSRNYSPLIPSEKEQYIFKSYIPNENSKITYIQYYTSDEKLRKFYICWLNNTTKHLDKVWKCFCSYEKSINDNFTSNSLSMYNTNYLNAKNAYRELCILYKDVYYEKKIKIIIPINNMKWKRENNLLYTQWMNIINFEKNNPLKLKLELVHKRIMYVYEQALLHLQFNSELWFSYFQFLLLNKKYEYAIRIMREAIEVYLPFDELLKLHFAYFFEKHSFINQAHFVYQLMLREVSKRGKKFSLPFLFSKEGFKRGIYCHTNWGKKKRKRDTSENTQEVTKGAKSEGGSTSPNGDGAVQCIGDESGQKSEHADETRDHRSSSSTSVGEEIWKELSSLSDEDMRRKFNHNEYEKIEERKKYFVRYINVDKNKRRDFVYTHFLNFIKRNYDETIWRYYVGIILNEKECSQYMYYYCANMERRMFHNEKRALYIMNEGHKKFSSKKKFLLFFIKFLLEKGNIDHIRCLIYKFIHSTYVSFYEEYEKGNNTSTKKSANVKNEKEKAKANGEKVKGGKMRGEKAKDTHNEFNQFEADYIKLLKKKNKSCDKVWKILTQLEIMYGDVRNMNKIYETKLKYESGYNLEENKNILLNFANKPSNNKKMLLEDSSIVDILCKGYLDNLRKNDIDNLQFKINLVNSQLFGGTSFKNSFDFFQLTGENIFSDLTFCDFSAKRRTKRKEEGNKKREVNTDTDAGAHDSAINTPNEQSNCGSVNQNVASTDRVNRGGGGLYKNCSNYEDMVKNEIESDTGVKADKKKKKKKKYIKKSQMCSTYDPFNFLDSQSYVKKKKKSNTESAHLNKEKVEDKTDVTNPVSCIVRPDLKTMSLYKPFENFEHFENEEERKYNERKFPMNDKPYYMNNFSKKNKCDEKDDFFKREYFSMPNIINDFLSLLPEENSSIKLSDNSIDYLITSLQNLSIPKLKNFPYEPIPVKEIMQIKNEMRG